MQRYLFALLIISIPFLALAKNDSFIQSASIVADSIEIDAKGNLTAKGNVEIHHDNNILKAREIFYQRSSDKLTAKGPISLIDGTGDETKADSAVFENGFQEAILKATQVILKNQLEITAEELKYWQSTCIGFYNGLNNSRLFILCYGYTLTGSSTYD